MQNGASRVQAVAELAPLAGQLGQAEMRLRLARRVAELSAPRWRDDVRGRKTTLAQGGGPFRGRDDVLVNCGLDEVAAA